MTERDLDKNPYSPDEKRIVDFIWERGLGGGDDPIGFILDSYAYLVEQRNTLREALKLARGDMQRAITEIDLELKHMPMTYPWEAGDDNSRNDRPSYRPIP